MWIMEESGLECVSFSVYFLIRFFKMKYLDNRKSKLRSVFHF
jgi:hypothetical protein